MLPLAFERRPLAILCLGAHSDDIEIGAGGTILTLLKHYPGSRVLWAVMSANAEREAEARASADVLLRNAASAEIVVHRFHDAHFPAEFGALKGSIEQFKAFEPDIVFTHQKSDHHQDHSVVAELTWNTFRNHLILEYEVLKYDPDIGNPNLFVPLTPQTADAKLDVLARHFPSQQGRRWFSNDTFMAMMRIRGVQSGAVSGLAEAFYAPKVLLWG